IVISLIDRYRGKDSIGERNTRPLLEAYHIPVIQGGFAANEEEAVKLANELSGRLVMKIVSPHILHKSDAGGIRLNLEGEAMVRSVFREMMSSIGASHPDAHLEGVLLERMAPKGVEVIVGMRRDPSFGPLIMFGLGGIYVELFNDVSFRIAPVSQEEARAMIFETRAGKLLTGYRGQPVADIDALVACIQNVSRLSLDFPEIEEAEINPLLVFPAGEGAVALDGRVILGGK
nr:acetate--CoA ligase family protein [Anaerolinea sp.]